MSDSTDPLPPARRTLPVRWALRGLAAAVPVALLIYGVTIKGPTTSIHNSMRRGQSSAAPEFRLAVLQAGSLGPVLAPRLSSIFGKRTVGLNEYQGTPVVLNIWASWCVPCQEEALALERAWRQLARPEGVLFLGDNQQDTTSDARAFMRRYHIDYPNLRLPAGEFANHIPETFFISAQGKPVGQIIGVISTEQLTAGIAAALNGQVRGDPLQFLQ